MLRVLANGDLDFSLRPGEAESTALPNSFLRELEENFARSTAAGLLQLATTEANQPLPADLQFWRNFVHLWLHTVCLQPRDADTAWNGGPPADSVRLDELTDQAPLASGLEYLQPAHLKTLWHQLNSELTRRIKRAHGDIAAVVNRLQPAWRLVGRVTLHLGENKTNHELPFAFLATYSPRLNARGEVQYLPLAQALKESAATNDRELLRNLLTPLHTASERSPLIKSLLETKKLFQVLPWTPAQAFGFLESIPVLEQSGLLVKVPDWWTNRRPSRPKIQVTIQNGPKSTKTTLSETLLKFDLSAALDDQTLTPAELEKLLQSDAPLVSLKGQWVEVDAERLRQALEFWNKVEAAHEKGVPFHQGMRWLAGLQGGNGKKAAEPEAPDRRSEWVQVTASADFQKLLYQIREPSALPDIETPIPGLLATLRPYQKVGVAWMDFLGRLGLGACLADDMGLGKTVQVLALLLRRRHARNADEHPRPHLLVVPGSLIGNWQREIEKFAPALKTLVAHRSAQKSGGMEALADGAHKALQTETVVITTYHTLGRLPGLLNTPFDVAVLDESQAIKNADTGLAKTVKQINARVRLALSGTPVENSLADLWSLFDFLNPGLLGAPGDFALLAKRLSDAGGGFAPLRKLIRPYILRRMKTDPDIAPELPAKTEMTAFCGLTKNKPPSTSAPSTNSPATWAKSRTNCSEPDSSSVPSCA